MCQSCVVLLSSLAVGVAAHAEKHDAGLVGQLGNDINALVLNCQTGQPACIAPHDFEFMALRVVAHHVVVLGNPNLIFVNHNLAAVELAKPSRAFFVKVVACKVLRIAVVQDFAQQRCTCWCKTQHCAGRGLTILASRRDRHVRVRFQLGAQVFEHNNVMLACRCHTDDQSLFNFDSFIMV